MVIRSGAERERERENFGCKSFHHGKSSYFKFHDTFRDPWIYSFIVQVYGEKLLDRSKRGENPKLKLIYVYF